MKIIATLAGLVCFGAVAGSISYTIPATGKRLPTVCRLVVDIDNDGSHDGSGSCVLYRRDIDIESRYFALTCNHLVAILGTLSVDIFIPDSEGNIVDDNYIRLPVRLEAADKELDLAVISFSFVEDLDLAVLSPKYPRSFSKILALGCAHGNALMLTEGYFCFLSEHSRFGYCTSPISNGNSGGAILDGETLHVIGITQQMEASPIMSPFGPIYIPVRHVHKFIPSPMVLQWLQKEKLI